MYVLPMQLVMSKQAKYAPGFEPYVLMKTTEMPPYGEKLLDRMNDKVVFTEALNKRGLVQFSILQFFLFFCKCALSQRNAVFFSGTNLLFYPTCTWFIFPTRPVKVGE